MKKLSIIFGLLAILLSHIMCIVVTYNYCAMGGVKPYFGAAPASLAFLLMIPYMIGIVICIVLSIVFKKRAK